MNEKYFKAIRFANEKHAKQVRKIEPFPYIVHIFEVTEILKENGASEDALIAAVLHDTVEDTGTSLEEIKREFGEKIALLVDFLSEKKSMPYVERKQEHADRLKRAPIDAKMVKCADSLSNLRTTYYNEKYGIDVWSRFNSTKENIKTHYLHSIEVFEALINTKMYKELVRYYQLVFAENFNKNNESEM